MKSFKYADELISAKEIMIAVPSMVIGVGVLSLPGVLADSTMAADGLFLLLVAGIVAILFTWLVSRLAVKFPHQSFFEYCSLLVSRPVSIAFSVLWAFQGIFLVAYETRVIAAVSIKYLFDQTPLAVIGLVFLLVVMYAVFGSRVGLFRLNMLFFPIIVFISIVLVGLALVYIEKANFLPVFETDISELWKATQQSLFSFVGFGIILFYAKFVKNPKELPKKAAFGMSFAVGLYTIIFIVCIGSFGNQATGNLLYPTVELAKEVEVPGGFFERFESLFFVIWIMAIFNTTAIALDVSVLALNSLFKKDRKKQLIFVLAPLAYLIGMLPKDAAEVTVFGTFISYYGLGITVSITIILLIIAKLRKVKPNE